MGQLKPQTQLAGVSSLLKDECVFFGTGYISRRSLEALQSVFSIEAVITKSDRRVNGRLRPTAVSQWAKEHNTHAYHADSAQDLQNIFQQTHLRSQLAVVVDYGVLIPETVINYFPLGIVNSHFSLLPQYRGPNPIRAPLLAGDTETGVTLMSIVAELDKGPIIAQKAVQITKTETVESLTQKLIDCNATLLQTELLRYARGETSPVPQDETKATWSQKTKKEDGVIDWTKPATQIEREIRAFLMWPASRTSIKGKDVTITKAHALPHIASGSKPGNVTVIQEDGTITVATGDGTLSIERLKPAGRQEMSAGEFIRGYIK